MTDIAFRGGRPFNVAMSNRPMLPQASASLLIVVGISWLVSGCVAAIVPVAAGGLAGRRVLHHRKAVEAPPPSRDGDTKPAPAPGPPVVAVSTTSRVPIIPKHRPPDTAATYAVTALPEATAVQPPMTAAPPAVAKAPAVTPIATTWEAVARRMAGLAAKTPDAAKTDVLQSLGAAHPTCGARPVAIAIDAATLGSGAYLYVGALYTMGYEIVLTARLQPLPPARVAALAKQGVPVRVAGRTLFAAPAGEEALARTMIAKQWCVAALVGNRAADFPGGVLPGTTGAHDGWFLVATPHR